MYGWGGFFLLCLIALLAEKFRAIPQHDVLTSLRQASHTGAAALQWKDIQVATLVATSGSLD